MVDICGHVAAAGLEIDDKRGAFADHVEVIDGQRDTGFAGHGEQVQHGIGRATRGGDARDSVFERLPREDVARGHVLAHDVHDEVAAARADVVFARINGGDARRAHGREADQFHDRRHGVGGELAAAGARAGTSDVFDFVQFGIADLAGRVRADGFEHVLNRHVFATEVAGHNRAAVENDAGHVETQQRHGRAGNGFVASDQRHDAVEHVAARHQFDGVGDHFAADQRRLHALGAHGDAVADGDGVELHRRAAGCANALLDLGRQIAQFEIARHGLDPGVGDADDGLQVVVGEADGLEHGSRA